MVAMISLTILFVGVLAVDARGVAEKQWDRSCHMEFYQHYFAKECVPQGTGTCPESFVCPEIRRDSTKCHYRGTAYDAFQPVPVDDRCSPDCFCRVPHSPDGMAEIVCAILDCPSVFRRPDPNCRAFHTHDRCCSTCLRDESVSPVTCHANNKTYSEGQFIDYDEFPCQSCICEEGHNGPHGPGCQALNCGFDFRDNNHLADGCVPIYLDGRCCAFEWICPNDLPPSTNVHQQQKQDGFCYLGDHQFEIGQRLQRNKCEVVCGCKTPPELTCVEYSDCEKARSNNIFPVHR